MAFQKSEFKNFVTEMYYKNVDERFYFKEDRIPFKEYVNKNKWFLKYRYKEELNRGNT